MDKKDYWEVRRDGVPLAGGPKSTMPDAKQRPMSQPFVLSGMPFTREASI